MNVRIPAQVRLECVHEATVLLIVRLELSFILTLKFKNKLCCAFVVKFFPLVSQKEKKRDYFV